MISETSSPKYTSRSPALGVEIVVHTFAIRHRHPLAYWLSTTSETNDLAKGLGGDLTANLTTTRIQGPFSIVVLSVPSCTFSTPILAGPLCSTRRNCIRADEKSRSNTPSRSRRISISPRSVSFGFFFLDQILHRLLSGFHVSRLGGIRRPVSFLVHRDSLLITVGFYHLHFY